MSARDAGASGEGPAATDPTPAQMHVAPPVGPLPSLLAPRPLQFTLSNGIQVVADPGTRFDLVQ